MDYDCLDCIFVENIELEWRRLKNSQSLYVNIVNIVNINVGILIVSFWLSSQYYNFKVTFFMSDCPQFYYHISQQVDLLL